MKTKTLLAIIFFPMLANAENLEKKDVIVFTAPPRGSLEAETKTYKPIADYLSKVLNKKVVYKQPMSWMHYQKDMWADKFDIVFDGPHFVSWRMNNTKHTPLIKLPDQMIWVIVARKDNTKVNKLKDIEGKGFCGQSPPNLGTLTVRSLVDAATREPRLVSRKGWKNVYKGVIEEKACVAGVMPITNLKQYDPQGKNAKIIYKHIPFPNQALTVSSEFSLNLRDKIRKSLLTKEGQNTMQALRKRYTNGNLMVPANKNEYKHVTSVLNDVYGYGFKFDSK
ncbi:MAG: phosphate/phosphite/phosphonate ABC transporter substrate-binding protein [Gammaproteobacteria bacterium]|nr:phosphate/phosphite/phosphonate ABC transporter substrate-binding protein [Gammaproteobacteria bacterium]